MDRETESIGFVATNDEVLSRRTMSRFVRCNVISPDFTPQKITSIGILS